MADYFNACTYLVDRQVEAGRGEYPAVRCGGRTLTYTELADAARLLGAATGIGPWDADADVGEALEQQFFEPARLSYGEPRWSKAHDSGSRLSLVEAIAVALGPKG